jgi:hypothetical protein
MAFALLDSPPEVLMRFAYFVCALGSAVVLAACGKDTCDPVANTGCEGGLTCELVSDGDPACFRPLYVRGDVFDLGDDAPVMGARVVALDVNGSPTTSVAITDVMGEYSLQVAAERNADGVPVDADVTLRVDARGYQTFPSGIRQAIPISLDTALATDEEFAVDSALTRVGLIELPAGSGTASISGTVEVPDSRNGVLVVAETANTPGSGFTAIADTDGNYTIFNLPAAAYAVTAYSRGSNYTPGNVTLTAGQAATLNLNLSDADASDVSGSVILVEGAPATSVILVVASTFNNTLQRGETPPGLRAPDPGILPNIGGPWTITGVPAGRYAVLAAFENDGSVRDQSGIGGTALVFIDVVAGQPLAAGEFKVTKSLTTVGPGANAPESITGNPTLTWLKDPSSKDYHVQVFNALGETVMDHHTLDGAIVSVAYAGTPLVGGMYYQFRVTSYDDASPTPFPIANTEDLRGVFFLP